MTHKWRPPLALVIGGALAAVLFLPVLGIAWFKLAGNILGWLETAQLFALMAVLATAILAWLLWRLVLRPVWALTAHARAMKSGRTDSAPPDHFGTPEFRELADSVIQMGDALNARARSLTAYADHVTHELKSPLTSLRGAADLLRNEALSPEDRAVLLATVETSTTRMEHLLNDLRAHATARMQAEPGTTTLSEAVALARVPDALELQIEANGPVPMSAQDLSRVLTQMAQNASENEATQMRLVARAQGVSISDNGGGIQQGDRTRIFDPFFTTRRDSGGTGMGLSIARTLIEAAGGQIVLGTPEKGAEFHIQF